MNLEKILEETQKISISDYLGKIGIFPNCTRGKRLVYFSPIRQECTPSFYVDTESNKFKDFGDEAFKGDVLDLVQRLENCGFRKAVEILENFESAENHFSFSLSANTSQNKPQILEIKPLTHSALINYANGRKIAFELVFQYCKEIHYSVNGKKFFSIGFPNDNGGFATRNGLSGGKNCIAPNGITVFDKGTKTVNLFEGFFDFLSALQYYNTNSLKNTTIVLNTTNNLSQSIRYLSDVSTVNCFFDNDNAGQKALNQLVKSISSNINVINQSEKIYPNSKDFNNFLLESPNSFG